MNWGMAGAFGAAICYGGAAVLEAEGAGRVGSRADGDASGLRVIARVISQLPFIAGLALDLLGFLLSLVALRSLPLFLVQSAVAGSLAVTALLAGAALGVRLARPEWLAVGGVCAGLALLGLTAAPEAARASSTGLQVALTVAAVAIAATGLVALRTRCPAVVLGTLAGLGFSLTSIAVRTIGSLRPVDLLREPAAYVVLAGGACGLVFIAAGLNRGSVAPVTAAMTVAQTIGPALVGVLLLGDRPRSGLAAVAAVGFVLAVGSAIALARFGEVKRRGPDAPVADTPVPDTPVADTSRRRPVHSAAGR